ncbi:hypothetical protein GCM10028802_21880 [Terrabacter terrigena]|uniref:TolB family protein n=1 Tax=Terrabacter terrigena TaxID=574718 RepID=A0ABW3N1Q2_9MICO
MDPLVAPSASVLTNLDGHLRILRADGTGGKVAVPSIDAEGTQDEVLLGDWSPDGNRLSFTRVDRSGTILRASVWVANSDGSGARQVYSCPAPCQRAGIAAWSPGGDQLAYVVTDTDASRTVGVRSAVEVVSVASGRPRVVVESRDRLVDFAYPRWSPDGRRLVVQVTRLKEPLSATSDGSGAPSVAVVDVAGPPGQAPRVLAPQLPGGHPDWSWKTDTIIFATNDPEVVQQDGAERNLWTVRPDGSELRQVTRFVRPAMAAQPSWTSDGTIAFLHCVAMPECYLAYATADGSVVQTPQQLAGLWPRVKPVA